jgi:hypothetical protein
MGSAGISLAGTGSVVDKVHADGNGLNGITVFGGIVSGSSANGNGSAGIGIFLGSAYGNVANNNGGFGIQAECPSSIVNNTAVGNPPALNFFLPGGIQGPCATANNAGQ